MVLITSDFQQNGVELILYSFNRWQGTWVACQ